MTPVETFEPELVETETTPDLKTTLETLEETISDINRRKSPAAGAAFLKTLTHSLNTSLERGEIDRDSLIRLGEEIEEIPDLEEVQEKALRVAEKQGVISFSPEGEIIAHLEKIRRIKRDEVALWGPASSSPYYGQGQKLPTLYFAFKGLNVISEGDYQGGKRKGKPLFYTPTSKEEAFDIRKIREADFYLGFWELGGPVQTGTLYPSEKDQLNYAETALACLIYHPNYSKGFRDERGRLLIKDPESNQYRPLSRDRLFAGSTGVSVQQANRPYEFVLENCPNLVAQGLLKPEDFRVVSGRVTAERHFWMRPRVDSTGCVMIDRVRYYLGKGFKNQMINIWRVSENLGLITQRRGGKEEITYTFPLRSAPSVSEGQKPQEALYLNKEQTGLAPYNPKQFHEKRADENEEDYRSRINALTNFEFRIKFFSDVTSKIGIPYHLFSEREQEWIAATIDVLQENYDEVIDLARRFGLSGLKSFLAGEYGAEYGKRILTIARNLEKSKAEAVFKHYTQIVDLSERFARGFQEVSSSLSPQINEAILRRAKDILNTAFQIARKGKAETLFYQTKHLETGDIDEVIAALKVYHQLLEILVDFQNPKAPKNYRFVSLPPATKVGDFESAHFRVNNITSPQKRLHLTIQTRSKGTREHIKDREFDGEARINFLFVFNPKNPNFISEDLQDPERKGALSFRLDRDCRNFKDNQLVSFDPTQEQARLSLEVGTVFEEGKETENMVLGRVISLGNAIGTAEDAQQEGKTPSYYHNWESFSPEFGKSDVFEKIVADFRAVLAKKYPAT